MLDVIVPVYNKELFINRSSIYTKVQLLGINLIYIDDSKSQDLDTVITESNNVRLIKNGCNRGTLYSRINGILNSSSRFVVTMDSDDVIIPRNLDKLCYIVSDGTIDVATSGYYECNENNCTKEEFMDTSELINKSDKFSLGRAVCLTSSVWNGYVLRDCISDLLNSKLLDELYKICGTDKICIQEDQFLWMWCKDWLYNHRKSYAITWVPTAFYNQFNSTKDYQGIFNSRVDYNDKILTDQVDSWRSILKSYFKY